jgi:hypothetical protein
MKSATKNTNRQLLSEHTFSIFLGIYLVEELQGHILIVGLTFLRPARLFSTVTISFYILTSDVSVLTSPHPQKH